MFCEKELINQGGNGIQKGQALKAGSSHEASLVEAAQRGDLSAFNQLVIAHQDDVYRWVLSYVKDEQTAEDVTQQVFITAYQKIHTLRDDSFRAWIFRIARNRSIDEIRTRQRHPSVSLDSNPRDEEDVDLLSVLPANDPSPEEAAIQAEQTGWLMQLLDELPEPFRQVIQLVDLYEMDYQEAAAVLNLPSGTLKSRLSRARLRLRTLMERDLISV